MLVQWAEGLENDIAAQTLGLDTKTLKAWGKLYAKHEAKGFNMDVTDSLITATALVHKLTVVTRNTSRSRLGPIVKVAKTLKARLENIVSYFRHRITNATAEGLNSKIQALKANARGFRNFFNYRTRILFFCGKLDLSPL